MSKSSISRLPEEVLLEILEHNSVLSEDAFTGHAFTDYGAGTFDISRAHLAASYPLDRSPASTDAVNILLTSKQFLRIGTPLLYASIHIHTQTQLHQLAYALIAQPCLGALVNKLRFEATCALFLDRVVGYMPNVHTLVLSLDFPTECGFHCFPYPSRGLSAALKMMRPERLMLQKEKGGFLWDRDK